MSSTVFVFHWWDDDLLCYVLVTLLTTISLKFFIYKLNHPLSSINFIYFFDKKRKDENKTRNGHNSKDGEF